MNAQDAYAAGYQACLNSEKPTPAWAERLKGEDPLSTHRTCLAAEYRRGWRDAYDGKPSASLAMEGV